MEAREVTVEDLGHLPPLTLANFTQGLPPWLIDWFLHSNDPKAIENRREVKLRAAAEIDDANARQSRRYEAMKKRAPPDKRSPIKHIACIDPVIYQDFRNRYGQGCWNNREFLEDCRRKAPQLFYPR